MMQKFISFIMIIVMLAFTMPAYADDAATSGAKLPKLETPAGEVEMGAVIAPMKKGQAAPFTGVLLSPRASASLTVQINSINEQIKIEVERARNEANAQCEFKTSELKVVADADRRVSTAMLDSRDKDIKILQDNIKQHEKDEDNSPFWYVVSGVGGLLAGVGLAVAASAANNATAR